MRITMFSRATTGFARHSIAQGVAALLACLVTPVYAGDVDNDDVVIDAPGTPGERWTVRNGGTLTANPGATLGNIIVTTNGSLLTNGATVHATGANVSAIELQNTSAVINNSTVTSENGVGLSLGTGGPSQTGIPQATVNDSTISGAGFGARVSREGTLVLNNSVVTATSGTIGGYNVGVVNFDSTVIANGGSITGANGVWLASGAGGSTSNTVLNGTSIVGLDGAGILIQEQPGLTGGRTANLLIENGTSITGSNGKIIESIGGIDSTIVVDNSQLTGDVTADGTGKLDLTLQNNASITGSLVNVNSLAVNSNGKWALTGDNDVSTVTMDGGLIDIHGTAAQGVWHTLNVENLSGNGTFAMQADLAAGESDKLNLTNGSGAHQLAVTNSGKEGGVERQVLVDQTSGDAQFSLIGDKVDAGVYSYVLNSSEDGGGGQSWYLERTGELSPSTGAVLGIHSALPVAWLGEQSVLRARLGEVRLSEAKNGGAWARTFGNRFNARPAMGGDYGLDQWGVLAGADAVAGANAHGHWLIGGMAGTSTSRLNFDNGSRGSIESHTAGAYATWLGNNGYYVDGVLKYNRFASDLDVRMSNGVHSKGNFVSHGMGGSAEVGRTFVLADDWFVSPYGQIAGMWASGSDFSLDNGMQVKSAGTRSLVGTLGVNFGKTFETSMGTFQPYGKIAVSHEFLRSNAMQVNGIELAQDLSGTRVEVGAGLAAQMEKNLQAYVDVTTSMGKRLDKPWGVNVGVRYRF
ncbi:autotransporter outer membrane beta-barrel domain-containing protein [Pandoraea sp. NPDC087047]|uniref:autotransporter outer membrane beta-barrel domain-containing protein n=1 Tax=Pandoraea sp. NPDC087047 TaxID=3364390 RepID=UPI003802D434